MIQIFAKFALLTILTASVSSAAFASTIQATVYKSSCSDCAQCCKDGHCKMGGKCCK